MLSPDSRCARVALIGALLACVVSNSGCADQRQWDGCALVGAVLGAASGATIGIVIADQGHRHTDRHNERDAWGWGGAGVGAILGTAAMHYICDPLIERPRAPVQVAEAAPPPPPPEPAAPVAPPQRLVLRGVHFDFNRSNIRPESEPILEEAAETLRKNPNLVIQVNGYCDIVGSDEYNLGLSERRAEAVVRYLEAKGVAASRLIAHGYGKTHFVASNDTDAGRAENRRVEMVPVGQAQALTGN